MSDNAISQAKHYYREHGRDMNEDMAALLRNPMGVLVYTPSLVVLAKAVRHGEELLWGILDDNPESPDAWYIHLMAGKLATARQWAAALPPLDWCCFHRGSRHRRPHIMPWARFMLPDTPPSHDRKGNIITWDSSPTPGAQN